jgi:hypothetical protein
VTHLGPYGPYLAIRMSLYGCANSECPVGGAGSEGAKLSAEQIADGDGISERTEPFYDQDFVTAAQDSPALRCFLFRQHT